MDVADVAAGVDEVLRRPVLVPVGAPGPQLVVLDDGIADAFGRDRRFDVRGFALERELGAVDADDRQAVFAVALVPGLQVGQRADAVDAGVGPEVDEDDPAPQAAQRQRLTARGVEPLLGFGEFGRRAVVVQWHGVLPARRLPLTAGGLSRRGPRSDSVPATPLDRGQRRLGRGGLREAFGRVD